MQLALGPKTLAFVGASGKEDVAKVRELVRTQADNWPEAWVDYKRVA
jgi:type IV secretion system protein VirB4